ncbi:unnamed protein product, partial [Mesorhabditis belari]|uniref:Uncharacterized protein n=1 Tax=Mesorhabditis belari TaxID=2138241 RepID=A0AAF3EZT7_9BILA
MEMQNVPEIIDLDSDHDTSTEDWYTCCHSLHPRDHSSIRDVNSKEDDHKLIVSNEDQSIKGKSHNSKIFLDKEHGRNDAIDPKDGLNRYAPVFQHLINDPLLHKTLKIRFGEKCVRDLLITFHQLYTGEKVRLLDLIRRNQCKLRDGEDENYAYCLKRPEVLAKRCLEHIFSDSSMKSFFRSRFPGVLPSDI